MSQEMHEKLKIREEVLNSPEIQNILFEQLSMSFGNCPDYWGDSPNGNNTRFMTIVRSLQKIEQASAGEADEVMKAKMAIFQSLGELYYSDFNMSDVAAEYIAIFYVNTQNDSIKNTKSFFENKNPNFPTTTRILEDLLTLQIKSNNKEIENSINNLILQASTQNQYISEIRFQLQCNFGVNVLRKSFEDKQKWERAKNAWVNKKHSVKKTLFKAAEEGDLDILKVAFEENKFYLLMTKKDDITLLHRAIVKQQCEVVKFLLENGADLHAESDYAGTPWYVACRLAYGPILTTIDEYNTQKKLQSQSTTDILKKLDSQPLSLKLENLDVDDKQDNKVSANKVETNVSNDKQKTQLETTHEEFSNMPTHGM